MKYIFLIKVKSRYSVNDYVTAWKQGSKIIQKMPGARGTRLYHKFGSPRTLLAIAEWDSKEARNKAMTKLKNSDEKIKEILHKHRKYARFIKIGEFDETNWKMGNK